MLTDSERACLERAYAIIDEFSDFMESEVTPAMNTLFMSDRHESLKSACGYISELLDDDARARLAITSRETRDTLSDAYQGCALAVENLNEDGEARKAALFLMSCLYGIINMTYAGGPDKAQEAVQNVIGIAECALEAINTLRAAGSIESEYLSLSGQKIEDRYDQLERAFRMLLPRYDPDKAPDEGDPEGRGAGGD